METQESSCTMFWSFCWILREYGYICTNI